jgi:hypothetical protein
MTFQVITKHENWIPRARPDDLVGRESKAASLSGGFQFLF